MPVGYYGDLLLKLVCSLERGRNLMSDGPLLQFLHYAVAVCTLLGDRCEEAIFTIRLVLPSYESLEIVFRDDRRESFSLPHLR